MKLLLEASHLARVLDTVRGSVPNRTTMPILQHVHLRAEGSTLSVRATNLECEASAEAPCQIDETWNLAIPGTILCGIAAKLSSGAQVSFELNDGDKRVVIKSGTAKFAVRVMPPDDYPSIGHPKDGCSFDIGSKDFASLFEVTNYAAGRDVASGPQFHGVHLHAKGGRLIGVASDTKRLGLTSVALPKGAEGLPQKGIICSLDGVKEFGRLLKELDELVTVTIDENLIRLQTPTLCFTSRLVDSTFVDYARIIPKLNGGGVSVHPVAFKDALDRAAVVYASGLHKYEPAIVETAKGCIKLKLGEQDESTEEVEAEVKEPGQKIKIDSNYLSEMLKQWPEDAELSMHISGPGQPIAFVSEKYPATQHLIMPMTK